MKKLLILLSCLGLAGAASGQVVLTEDFDGGTWPPAGWTVIDNTATASGSWNLSSAFTHGNLSGGTGECAAIDSDAAGIGSTTDGELITPAFTVPTTGYIALEFNNYYHYYTGDYGDVDVRVGGGSWTTLLTFAGDTSGLVSINLTPYAGSSVEVRFHYVADWDWYWHVDDVIVHDVPPPPVPIWLEDFDGGTWPPAGWSVVDNTPTLAGSWDLSSAFNHGNLAGTGLCAAIDSDNYGVGIDIDGELITFPFDVPASGANFEFDHFFNYLSGEIADLDIRVGGGTWTNLASWMIDASGHEVFDLGAYAGATNVEIRFHYYLANYDWYWHVDNVGLWNYTSSGPGISYCAGDGVAPHTGCPCGNNNSGGLGGCDWGHPGFTGGGLLTATGSASMSANDTVLVATSVENNFGIFFGANDQVNGGNGNLLNDGLRCAGGALVRLVPPTMAAGHQAILPQPVQTLDTGAAAGTTRRYQYWFRTPGGPCGSSANLTNGYEIAWVL